jgi:hypothetical protein
MRAMLKKNVYLEKENEKGKKFKRLTIRIK